MNVLHLRSIWRLAQPLHYGHIVEDEGLPTSAFSQLPSAPSASDILRRIREDDPFFLTIGALDKQESAPRLGDRFPVPFHAAISAFLSLIPSLIISLLHSLHLRRRVAFLVVFAVLITLHLGETCVWAAFYLWRALFADYETSLYFSLQSYTTIGYGDVALPPAWRLLGGIEGITGVLLCGLSTAFLFTVLTAIFHIRLEYYDKVKKPEWSAASYVPKRG